MESVVLNMVGILGIFLLDGVRVSDPHRHSFTFDHFGHYNFITICSLLFCFESNDSRNFFRSVLTTEEVKRRTPVFFFFEL